ncbi:MAG: alkaline phosphatase D family protein [Nitrospirae bacterium]|nr:alkaline phosphatase D family protein [Candidatus Manganitrophaceae bacterium]
MTRRAFKRSTRLLIAWVGPIGFMLLIALPSARAQSNPFPDGVASAEVTSREAIVWTRLAEPGLVTAEVSTDPTFSHGIQRKFGQARVEDDLTVQLQVNRLTPQTTYYYRFGTPAGAVSEVGVFKTAPRQTVSAPVRFVFTGDSDGTRIPGTDQRIFGDFKVLDAARRDNPDFFVYLGDTIYADSEAGAALGIPPASDLNGFRARYKENRQVPALRSLLASTSTYAIWDDHEVRDNFSGTATDPNLVAAGLKAFKEYFPIRENPFSPNILYRKFRWGKDAELFILDERMFRSPNVPNACLTAAGTPDLAPTLGLGSLPSEVTRLRLPFGLPELTSPDCIAALADPARTFLGKAQFYWLLFSLSLSDATFKFIVNELPVSELFLMPYDRWEGYLAERTQLLELIRALPIKNVIFLTTDLHGNIILDVRINRFLDPKPVAKEVIAGPIATTTFKTELQKAGADPALVETLLATLDQPSCIQIDQYSYGLVEVDVASQPKKVTITVKDENGQTVMSTTPPGPCQVVITEGEFPN